MKIIIDDKIPFIRGVLEPFSETVYLKGKDISNADIRDADALIVRTRTTCDAALLQNSKVRFIATATIGYDHIDTDYCEKNGIRWANAQGCNASSVAQYIVSALIALSQKHGFSPVSKTLGIVGVGNVGGKVAAAAEALGMSVLLNDPPREEQEGARFFSSIEQISNEADIITFHTPLVKSGKYKTAHLLNDVFFHGLKKTPFIINTARGEIANGTSLKKALKERKIQGFILDCWENEPTIDLELLKQAFIGTPHIAGYSLDGKANATTLSVRAVSRFFGFGLDQWKVENLPLPENPVIEMTENENPLNTVFQTYDIWQDDFRLRKNPELFECFRENYPLRREYGAYTIKGFHPCLFEKFKFRLD